MRPKHGPIGPWFMICPDHYDGPFGPDTYERPVSGRVAEVKQHQPQTVSLEGKTLEVVFVDYAYEEV